MKLSKEKSLGKRTKKGVVWNFLREGIGEAIAFPVSMVQARLLSPEEFGIAAAAGFFTLLAGRLSELGFNAAIVRAKEVRSVHLSTVFVMNVLMGVVSYGVLTSLAPLVGAFYQIPETGKILPIAAMSFLIAPLGAVPAGLLARGMKYREATAVSWANSLAFYGSSVLLAWLGFSYMSLVYGRLAGVAAQTTMRIYFARWRPSVRFSRAALREIMPYGIGAHAKRLLDYTAEQGDNLVVGKVLGMEALGLYDKAFSTMNRFLSRLGAGPGVTFRVFAIIHEEPDRFRRAYRKVVMAASLIAFPVFGSLMAVAPQLIVFLFGDRWLPSALPFQLLCVAGALKLLNMYASSATQAAGWIWSEVWRQAILILITIAAIVAFSRWGPAGAAGGVLLATAMMTAMMHVLLARVTRLRWRDIVDPLVPALMCATGAAGVAIGIEWLVRAWDRAPAAWFLLICQVPAIGTVIAAFVLFVPHADVRALVREVASDLAPAAVKRQRWVQSYLAEPS